MTAEEPAFPLPSATVLLLRDDPLQVLMIRRRAGGSFGSALVFPGGVVDPEDGNAAWLDRLATGAALDAEQRAIRIAAIREVYEEAGLLAAIEGPPVCERGRPFAEALGNGKLDLDALQPFSRWITPTHRPKRWDTHFYLCSAPIDADAICDGVEAVAVEWMRPAEALEREGRDLRFPTRMNLMRLAESRTAAEAVAAAAQIPVRPILVERDAGALSLMLADAGYPINNIVLPD